MKFECDSCGANYMIADEKVGKRGVKVKCKRCAHVIIVRPDAKAADVEAASPPTMDEDNVFGDSASGESKLPPIASSDDSDATAVGHPPEATGAGGDDVDLGSMAADHDDGADAFASSSGESGATVGSLLSDAEDEGADDPAGEPDANAQAAAHASGDDDAGDDDSGDDGSTSGTDASAEGAFAASDEDDAPAPPLSDELASFGDDDDEDETVAGGPGTPLGATLADEAHAASDPSDDGAADDAHDGGEDLAASTAADDDDVPPPPAFDEPPADDGGDDEGDDAKTSVGAVPGWQMSADNDTQMGASPDATDANLQMPSADDDGASSGLDGEGDALDALAGLGGGDDVPPPPEFDTGDSLAASASMPQVDDDGAGLGDAPPPEEAPLQGEESDAFDAQLAGAFSNMFGDAPAEADVPPPPSLDDMEGFRGPTQVLDMNQMDALRAEATPSEDGMSSGLDAAYASFNGGLDTAMGDPVEDTATQMADLDEDEGGWHVAIDDEDVGPLSLEDIAEHVNGGRVDRDSLVWRTGMDDWEPAGDVPQMARLFDSLPMPKIDPAFDVGAPIDDMGGGNDPFSNVPDVSADPNWQPHGLTDVYQAANLAEAAGLGLPTPGAGAAKPSADDEDEGEWRPGAAGALAALVEDEINRIDNPPAEELSSPGGLAPADDMQSGMFAEGAGAGAEVGGLSSAPSSVGFPVGGGLGVAGGLSSPAMSTPPIAMTGMSSPALSTPGMMAAQVPSVDTFPPHAAMSGFTPVQPPAPQKSNTALILGVTAVLGLLLVVGITAIAALVVSVNNNQGPVVAANPQETQAAPAGQGGGASGGDKVALAADAKATDDAAPAGEAAASEGKPNTEQAADTQPAGAAADGAKAEADKPTDDSKSDGSKGDDGKAEPAEAKAEPKKEEPKKVAVASKPEPRKTRRSSSRRGSSRASKASPPPSRSKPEPKPKRKESRRETKRSGDCDPILDIDCEEKKTKSKKRSKVKESLSKSDILVVVKKNIGSIMRCFKANNVKDQVKMEWKISKSGRTKGVRVLTSKYAGTPMGRCMTNAVKRFKFPAYSGSAPPPIKFPFKP